MKKEIILIATLLFSIGSYAQKDSLNAVIQVENDYNPVVIKANKQSFTPQIEMSKNNNPLELVFSQEATPYRRFTSERNVKELLPKQDIATPGYLRLGYGNNNNVDALLGYRLDISKNDRINIFASMNGFNTELEGFWNNWDSRMYDTWLTTDYTHQFEALSFGIETGINNKVFNYQTINLGNLREGYTDKQHSNSFNLMFNVKSNLAGPFSYSAKAGYRYNTRKYSAGLKERISENHIIASGSVAYELPNDDIQKLGMNVDLDGFIYSDELKPQEGTSFEDYASIRFNPFMNFRFDDWKIRLGVHADMLTANGTFFAFAPDCSIEGSITDRIDLYATATGGRTLNTFATMEEATPYWEYVPGITQQHTATYKIFDVSVGGRIAIEPLSVNLFTGYAYTKDDLLCTNEIFRDHQTNVFKQENTRNMYIGGQIGYDYGGWFEFAADARYDYWKSSGEEYHLLYKPEITINLNGKAQIYKGLCANLGYTFTRYTKSSEEPIKGRIANKSNLHAKIGYTFLDRFEAFVLGDNLLNYDYQIYPGYFAQGINFLIGATVSF